MTTTTDNSGGQPEELAREVKTMRLELKLTQRELAERLGVHPRSVSNWETGSVTPSPQTIDRLKQLLAMAQAMSAHTSENFSYYVMTYSTHRPSGVLGTLKSLQRRVDAISTELGQLIEELEQTHATVAAPKEPRKP